MKKLIAGFLLLVSAHAPAQVIVTAVGTDFLFPSGSLPATKAPLGDVSCLALDAKGRLFISDPDNSMVLMATPDGMLTTIAGNGRSTFAGEGGAATSASLTQPCAVADNAGNVYISDLSNQRIRKVAPNGIITTVAGTGVSGFSGDGGPATSARLNFTSSAPSRGGLALDLAGNLYVADTGNNRVRKITPDGVISTIAGTGGFGSTGDGEPARSATFYFPTAVAIDPAGTIYVADWFNSRVRRIAADGTITTVTGSGAAGVPYPTGLALDASGNLYIANGNIHRLAPNGTISTVSGSGYGIAVDAAGTRYTAADRMVVKTTPAGVVSVVAGNGGFRFSGDSGPAQNANLNGPTGLFFDRSGNLILADTANARIRRVTPGGTVTTLVQPAKGDFFGTLIPLTPISVAADPAGNLYIADISLRKVTPAGVETTLIPVSGNCRPICMVTGATVDAAGNVYIADQGSHGVYRLSPAGVVTTLATATGGGPGMHFEAPYGIALDDSGNIYVSDAAYGVVRKLTLAGPGNVTISNVAGNGKIGFSGDGGPALAAALSRPTALAFDSRGNLYIADTNNDRIRKVTPTGIISTVAGGGTDTRGDGRLATDVRLLVPQGVAVDRAGNLYVADTGFNRIRVVLANPPSAQVAPAALSFRGVSGGAPPPFQKIALGSGVAGMTYSTTVSTPDGNWLTVQPAAGLTPATLLVTADPSSLDPGIHNGVITVDVPGGTPGSFAVRVVFSVGISQPPKLSVDSARLSFTTTASGDAAKGVITVGNAGGGSLSFTAATTTASGGNWLTVTPADGSATPIAPAQIGISADPGNLPAGVYRGSVSVSSGETGEQFTLPVTMIVNPAQTGMLLSQTGMSFRAVSGGGAPLAQNLSILSRGPAPLNWTASARVLGDSGNWLTLSQTSGSTARPKLDVSTISVSADPTGLPPGTYFGQVTISASGGATPAQTVSIVLNVATAADTSAQIQPAGLIFIGRLGDAPGSQNLILRNAGISSLQFNSARLTLDGADWLQYIPQNASVAAVQPQRIVVQPGFATLGAGVHDGSITFLFADGSINVVRVSTVVGAPGCSPSRLVMLPANLPQVFTATQNLPMSIEVQVVDDCGVPLTADRTGAAVTVSLSNGDRTISLVPTGGGYWSNTWQPANSADGPVFITIAASLLPALTGRTDLEADLTGKADLPVISKLLNAASLVADSPVAPGSLFSLLGSGFANSTVNLAGQSATLLLTTGTQINGQAPLNIPVNTEAQLTVQRGGVISVPQAVVIAAAAPAIFTQDGSGAGPGVIADAITGMLNSGDAPAHSGDSIVIQCTGVAAQDQAVTVSIGGLLADVSAVRAGSMPGTYEIVAVVPGGIDPSDAVPVRISAAGQISPAVTMAVR